MGKIFPEYIIEILFTRLAIRLKQHNNINPLFLYRVFS
jgi:hypothetical protein